MEAGNALSLLVLSWILYLLLAPAAINPAPAARPVPQVVAGRVTGTAPPPNGSWAFWRELISPSAWLVSGRLWRFSRRLRRRRGNRRGRRRGLLRAARPILSLASAS